MEKPYHTILAIVHQVIEDWQEAPHSHISYYTQVNGEDTINNSCENCAFHNKDLKYECEMADDLPVICSVKMRKMKQEKREIKT